MAGVTPNEGEIVILNLVYKNAESNRGPTFELGLFTNSTGMDDTMTLASITEPTGSGYARITLTNPSWIVATDGSGQVSYPAQTFTATGNWTGDVRGYFIATTGTVPKLLHFEVDANGPYTMTNTDTYQVDLSNVAD